MISYCYSPLPIEDYRITSLPDCPVSSIIEMSKGDDGPAKANAVWNLMWLSMPEVDVLPIHGKTPQWFKHYMPPGDTFGILVADAINRDEALFRKLQLHPSRFLAFFEYQDHWVYDTFHILGQQRWVDTVQRRAKESAARMASQVPYLQTNNIYTIRRDLPRHGAAK